MKKADELTFFDKLLDFLLLFFIYLFVAAFPWRIIFDGYLSTSIRLLTGTLFLVGSSIFIHFRYPLQKRNISFKNLLLFLPFFLIPFSNLASSFFVEEASPINEPLLFTLAISETIVFAINEELLFRRLLLPLLLEKFSELKSLLISALAFGLIHFLNVFGSVGFFEASIQVLYSFGVGLITGLMYLYGKSLFLAISFHALFNVLQNDLYQTLYPHDGIAYWRVWATAIAAIFGVLYGLFIYLHFRKKEPSSSLDRQDK